MFLTLIACDFDVKLDPTDPAHFDTGDTDGDTDVDTDGDTSTLPHEECNGVDDDGDGLIDEGFDDDGNGRGDCFDFECPPLTLAAGGAVAFDEACEGAVLEEVLDPWNVAIEWRYASSGYGVATMPAIGNLTDDNGDGAVNADDTPDIVFSTYDGYTVAAVSGDGSGLLWEASGNYSGLSGVVLADVDGDGASDVVATTNEGTIVALDGGGVELWTSAVFNDLGQIAQCVVADLDANGVAEVICDAIVVSGADGSTVATLRGVRASYRTPVVADLDQDGAQEISLGDVVFDGEGNTLWTTAPSSTASFAAVGDLDGDDGGELFVVAGDEGHVYDSDGTELRSFALSGGQYPGPPAIADFDGDGDVELAVPSGSTLAVYEVDGTMVWSTAVDDISAFAGVSGFDVNADGAFEVLLADEEAFRIYDGATGAVLYESDAHTSGTLWEYPVVADVDGDGSAEIVTSENGGDFLGITVWGQVDDTWPPAGPTWPTHDFYVSNVSPDGHVPARPTAPWEAYDVFRARPADDAVMGSPDLSVSITDFCVADCTWGPFSVAVQVSNHGSVDVAAGATVDVWADDGEWLGTATLPAVPAGEALEAVQIDLRVVDLSGRRLFVRVDNGGAVDECDEDNNEAEFGDGICP